MKIEFFRHNIDEKDKERVLQVLDSIFLTTGSVVGEFENALSAYLGLPYTVGVTSCTAALHLSLLAFEIGEGDEVITTPMSFCATANAIIHAGARPVFVDVERDTGNIDAERIENAITARTRAIMPVHLYGQMCDMRKIRQIADTHGLVVIEDAAHALEARRDGVGVGQLADAVCFSFYATKNITSGEGGAVSLHNQEKADSLRLLRSHGIDRTASDRYTKRYQHWDMRVLGWKYNMDNIQAALLIGQLARIEGLLERRKTLWDLYRNGFAGNHAAEPMAERENVRHAMHLFTVLVDGSRRDALLHDLQEKGIGVAVNYRPIHLLSYYRKSFGFKEGDFPVAEEIGDRTISLPLYPKLTEEELARVLQAMRALA